MRKLLIVLVLLAAVAVIGDRVAEHVAEDQVATVVQEKEGLPAKPSVDFAGFPFLTQVMSNDISKVTMTLPQAKAPAGDSGRIRVEDVQVSFAHVSTSDNFHRATAQRMTGSARIPYDSISRLGPFTASYGGQNDQGVGVVTLTPDQSLGLPSGLSYDVGVETDSHGFSFLGAGGSTQITGVPPALEPVLSTLLTAPHQLYGLPTTFTIKSLHVTQDGIDLTLAGRNVELTR